MKGIVIVLCVFAVVFAYHGIKLLFGKSPLDALIEIAMGIFGKTASSVYKANESMRARTARMSREDRKKSWYYKYQVLLNDILLDLGWKQMGVTVEGLTIMVLIATLMLEVLGWIVFKNLFMLIIVGIATYATILAVLFSISRSTHRTRKALLIAAEDLLCANMSKGLTIAIRDNINQIDSEIRDDFKAYLNDIDCNMPVIEAIDRLNDRLGSKFDNFCSKAKDITENYQPGAEDSFMFNISSNAIETELDNEIYEANANANMDYFATLGLLGVFFFMTNSMYSSLREFYFKGPGKFFLVFYILAAIAVYIYTQWQGSRRT